MGEFQCTCATLVCCSQELFAAKEAFVKPGIDIRDQTNRFYQHNIITHRSISVLNCFD